MNALVREAIGFSAERGDSINIMNSPFTTEPVPEAVEVPMWKDPQLIAIAIDIALLGLIIVFKVIRPAMKSLSDKQALALKNEKEAEEAATRQKQLVDTVVADEVELISPEEQARLEAQKRRDETLRLARENPKAVASIVRDWVTEDE